MYVSDFNIIICLFTISSHHLSPSQTVQFVCANFIDYYIKY